MHPPDGSLSRWQLGMFLSQPHQTCGFFMHIAMWHGHYHNFILYFILGCIPALSCMCKLYAIAIPYNAQPIVVKKSFRNEKKFWKRKHLTLTESPTTKLSIRNETSFGNNVCEVVSLYSRWIPVPVVFPWARYVTLN